MKGWSQAVIHTIYTKRQSEFAFSFLKNVLDRAKYDDFFFTATVNQFDYWTIIVRFKNLKNPQGVEDYVKKVFKDEQFEVGIIKWSEYQRDHVLPMLIEASKISIKRDTLLSSTALHYLIHCVAMTSFLTPGQAARVWLDLLDNDAKKLFSAYLVKNEG
ncbi:hypothetical protein KAR91_87555 [Candidatus Pacearchaeota archaeon]|nr:hypothetical protein [Candidatus Pacearchaeota archaeon]